MTMNGDSARPLERTTLLLLGWGCIGAAYLAGAWSAGRTYTVPVVRGDLGVDCHPWAIWAYASFFVLVPFTFAVIPIGLARWLCKCFIGCALLAAIVYSIAPTTIALPPAAPGTGLGATLQRTLVAWDTPRNCLPSLHGALTALCAATLQHRGRPLRSVTALAWAALIFWGVLALRRHGLVDLGAGVLLAAVVARACTRHHHRMRY